ncbi:hypothetical protein T11_10392, partial [Trichinella zimbabwensis]
AEQARRAVNSKQSTGAEKTSSSTHKDTPSTNQRKRSYPQGKTVGAFHASFHPTCPVCQGKHRATVCQRFLNQRWPERKATAERLGMCFICLTPGHISSRCEFKSRGWGTHHLLKSSTPSRRAPLSEEPNDPTEPPRNNSPCVARQHPRTNSTGANGQRLTANCLFDSATETTLAWVVFGPVNPPPTSQDRCHCVQIEDDMEHLLKKFWELESIGIQQQEEITTQDMIAICRTQPEKDPVKQREYTAMIEAYLRNGWVEEVTTRVGNPVRHGTSPIMQCTRSLTAKRISGNIRRADLVNILLRFRQYRIAVQADIEKIATAYLMLLREGTDHTRVCFSAGQYINSDLVMSCDKEAQVRDLIRRVPVFLKKGGFHLKNQTSNRVELLDTLPEEDVSTNGEKEIGKTLGSCSTRRQMLSLTASFIGQKKMLFRRLWTTGLGWDAPLPPQIEK